jgi:hypothetical protein
LLGIDVETKQAATWLVFCSLEDWDGKGRFRR